jgi:hypothetical protein
MSLHLFKLPTMSTKKTTKLFALLSLSLALSFGLVASAADVDPNIVKLEKRFFEHDYPKDTTEARIERLEKMVFGEAKTGSVQERLKALMTVVPADDSRTETAKSTPNTNRQPSNYDATRSASDVPTADVKEFEDTPAPAGNYPAISAIENKLLGREFSDEPARKRLDRLETKVFGKPSGIDDMTERMDRLKMKTGVDVAKQAPSGSDWADDDDFSFDSVHPPKRTSPPLTYTAPPNADGTSFSGRNMRQDMQRNFGMPSTSSMGSSPQAAPDYRRGVPAQEALGGLNQQVTHLETLIFGKSYAKDSLPARVNRLELTLYPQQPLAVTTPLPDRVKRLLGTVPGAVPNATASRGYSAQPSYVPQQSQPSLQDDLDDMDTSMGGNFPQPAPQYQKRSSGLSKIINSIGNMMGSGYGGGYTTQSGTLVTDPQTGLLYDQATGVLIDPLTGAVVGQRYPANPSPGYGYGGFNNGFSPYGGGMGSGMRFGFGGMGGMWP